MPKKLNNIDLFAKTARKIGLKFTKTPIENNPNLFKISGNGKFYLGSAKAPGFYPTATRWCAHLTGNKKLSQTILKELGYKTITSVFLEPEKHTSFKEYYTAAEKKCKAFPAILKPNKGLDGRGIKYITDTKTLKRELTDHYKHKVVGIFQPIIAQSEYRILIVNGAVELVHSKDFRAVVGDGKRTIASLLSEVAPGDMNKEYIQFQYKVTGYSKNTILETGVEFAYHIVKNSSARYYQTKAFPKELLTWAKKLSADLSISTLGVDLFIPGDLRDTNQYMIIELNSNPGLVHYYTVCNDKVQPDRICEKVLRDYFKV